MRPELPERVGPYEVLGRLSHRGAPTEVFKARAKNGVLVCVKRMHPQAEDVEFALRFGVELELAAALLHVNLVTVIEHGHDGGPYFVMEWVDGVDLHGLLRSVGTLPPELVVYLGVELCRGLAYVHHSEWTKNVAGEREQVRGPVIHGDISPSNILLARTGFVKLADFGLARALGRTGLRTMAELVGKPMYWSPEQLEDDEVGVESDLFAVGLVLWRALVGTHPYAEGRPARGPARRSLNDWVAERTLLGDMGRRSVVEAAPQAPPTLQRVIEGLLQVREKRIGRAEELCETLRRIEPLDGHAQLGPLVGRASGSR